MDEKGGEGAHGVGGDTRHLLVCMSMRGLEWARVFPDEEAARMASAEVAAQVPPDDDLGARQALDLLRRGQAMTAVLPLWAPGEEGREARSFLGLPSYAVRVAAEADGALLLEDEVVALDWLSAHAKVVDELRQAPLPWGPDGRVRVTVALRDLAGGEERTETLVFVRR